MDPTDYVKLLSSRSPWTRVDALESEDVAVGLRLLGARACITDSHSEVRRTAVDMITGSGLRPIRIHRPSWVLYRSTDRPNSDDFSVLRSC
jgi:hypothetical protein